MGDPLRACRIGDNLEIRGIDMAFKIILNGWPVDESSVVVMDDEYELEQVRNYFFEDDRHGCTPSEIVMVDEPVTHTSYIDWFLN